MRNPRTAVGDVIRFTKFRWDEDEPDVLVEPFVALVVHMSNGVYGEAIILPGNIFIDVNGEEVAEGSNLAFRSSCDEWHIVPPDEWSDEICAAVAAFRLGEQA